MLIIIAARGLSAAMRVIKRAPTPAKWLSLSSNFACLRTVLLAARGLAAVRCWSLRLVWQRAVRHQPFHVPGIVYAAQYPSPAPTASASSPHPIVGGIFSSATRTVSGKSGLQRRSNRAPHFGNYWSRRPLRRCHLAVARHLSPGRHRAGDRHSNFRVTTSPTLSTITAKIFLTKC
jgi:hypothetical protein